MTLRLLIAVGAVAFCCILVAGCGPSQEQISLVKALSARIDREPDCNASAQFLRNTYMAKHDRDYVMWSMDFASLCIMGGNYDTAREELLRCYDDISKRQDEEKAKAAAASNESLKIFKGEPFERAMVCTYLSILHYMKGDYNNARIFSARADMEDASTNEDMKDYRHDFRLAHFWLGKAYLKLGQEGNARVAFQKAFQHVPREDEDDERDDERKDHARSRKKRSRLEKIAYENATKAKTPILGVADLSPSPAMSEMPVRLPGASPDESPVILKADTLESMSTLAFQKQVNLTLIIEAGIGPVKYLVGENAAMDKIIRAEYPERSVTVYLNEVLAGRAFRLLDMFHQADTRGTSEKDRVQMTKGILQSILRRLPYISYAAAYWDVRADHRYWHLLPGEVHIYSSKLRPGTYTISLHSFDANDHSLPRQRATHYRIPVHAGQENVYFLQTQYDHDNTYFPPKE